MMVYAARPIDQAGDLPEWVEFMGGLAQDELALGGHDVYRPYAAFYCGEVGAGVQNINEFALQSARGGVALLPAGVPTLGTPDETAQLVRSARPVLIVTDIERSAMVRSWERWTHVKVVEPEVGRVKEGARWLLDELERLARFDGDKRPLIFQSTDGGTVVRQDGELQSLLPSRGYPDDCGLDLFVSREVRVPAGGFADVPSGVRVDLPHGTWAMITGRSSTLRKRNLLVSTGVIDAGWTGELFAGVKNLGDEEAVLSEGERVAQLVLLPAPVVDYVPRWGTVSPGKSRGALGFGSTGD